MPLTKKRKIPNVLSAGTRIPLLKYDGYHGVGSIRLSARYRNEKYNTIGRKFTDRPALATSIRLETHK